jgi:hypothetical protein
MMPPESLKRRLLEAAGRQPVPTRPRRLVSGAAAAALTAAAMVAAYSAELWWGDLRRGAGLDRAAAFTSGVATLLRLGAGTSGRPAAAGLAIVAGTIVLAAAATWLTLPSRRSMLSPPRGQLLAVAFAFPLLVGAWHLLWGTSYVDPFSRVGWRCIYFTMATAPWPFLAVYRASRRLDPRHPALTGAALGSSAGAWGAVMAAIWCPLSIGSHVLVGHVLPVVLSVGLGAAIGYRMFRVRRLRMVST